MGGVIDSQNLPGMYVVVNYLSQVIFVFHSFLGMVMYANEVETKRNKRERKKINYNIYTRNLYRFANR